MIDASHPILECLRSIIPVCDGCSRFMHAYTKGARDAYGSFSPFVVLEAWLDAGRIRPYSATSLIRIGGGEVGGEIGEEKARGHQRHALDKSWSRYNKYMY